MDEVAAADAEAVAVAAGDQHGQLVVGQLEARGHRQRAAMQRVHAVGVDEAGEVGGAADAADRGHLVVGDLQLDQRLLHRGEHAEVAATGAPVGIDLALEVGHRSSAWERVILIVAIVDFSLNHDFVGWDGKGGRAGKLFAHRLRRCGAA